MTVPALRFHDVHKSFGGAGALNAFTLSVEPGECFGLVGANGAGKTTLIKCLLDFCEPDKGQIGIFGVPHRQTVSRARLAYLPERFNPPYYLTGRDFLQYMAKMHRAADAESNAAEMVKALDLDPAALDKPVRAYSKGMNQKLGLAACLLSGKDLYVLDEPTSGLDPRARILLKRKLKALRDGGKTIFFTSHALADVEEMCDRVAVIDGGILRFAGTPAELMRTQNAGTMEAAFMTLTAPETQAAS
ncbi:MAG TPA: ABC transporter ATP-binding protein [Burkholderiales bacterium]|nr:ABC transporter ATP-binding protein [Burkholderiales bacterium]